MMNISLSKNYAKSLEETCNSSLRPYFLQLDNMWRVMGLSTTEVETRMATVENLVADIMLPMVECEQGNLEKIKEICSNLRFEINSLWRKLKKPGEESTTVEDLTLIEQQKVLKTILVDLEDERTKVMRRFRSMIESERSLAHLLGMQSVFSDEDTIPGEEEVEKIEENIRKMLVVKEERETRLFTMKEEIVKLVEKLGMDLNATSLSSLVDGEDPTETLKTSDLRVVQEQMQELQNTLDQRLDDVRNLMAEIATLYHQLSVPSDRQCPLASGKVCGVEELVKEVNLEKLRLELRRMKMLRRKNLKKIIDQSLCNLEMLWEKSMTDRRVREEFMALTSGDDEETLKAIELQILEQETYINSNEVVLKNIETFLELCTLAEDLLKRMKDPNRLFKSRGNAMAKEEQDRKKVNRLPDLKEELLLLAERHGNLLVYNVPLSTMVEDYYGQLHHMFSTSDQGSRAGRRNGVAVNKTLGTTRSGKSFTSVAPKNKTASPRSFRRQGRLVTSPGATMVVRKRMESTLSRTKMFRSNTTLASGAGRPGARLAMVPAVQMVVTDSTMVNDTIDQATFSENVPYNSTILAGGQRSPISQIVWEQENTLLLRERDAARDTAASGGRRGGDCSGGNDRFKARRKMRRSNSCSDIQLSNNFRQRLGSDSRKVLGPIREVVSKLPIPSSGPTDLRARGKENRAGMKRTNSSSSLVLR